MKKSQILGVGSFLPKSVVKSTDLLDEIKSEMQYGMSRDWMDKEMGINQRRVADFSLMPSDLAIPACEKAISNSKLQIEKIDGVIFCGIERDRPEPATAHTIASKLGINADHVFDISNACYGFVEGMRQADMYIRLNEAKNILVCTGEIPSHVMKAAVKGLRKGVDVNNINKYIGALSVGDAGGAVIIGESRNGKTGFNAFNSVNKSRLSEKCYYNFNDEGQLEGQMEMEKISGAMVFNHKQLLSSTLNKLKWDKFDHLLSHQVGKKPFDRITKISGIASHIKTFDKLGNITSATFPINFEKLLNSDKSNVGDKLGGFFAGSGLVVGQVGYTL